MVDNYFRIHSILIRLSYLIFPLQFLNEPSYVELHVCWYSSLLEMYTEVLKVHQKYRAFLAVYLPYINHHHTLYSFSCEHPFKLFEHT